MPYTLDTEININHNLIYIISSQHRNNTNNKSKWSVSFSQEVACFRLAHLRNWCINFKGWGIIISKGEIIVLGRNRFNERIKIAKFIDSNTNNKWHGYPADYIRKVQDRPTLAVLLNWREKGYITKHQISKIRSGKKCNL